MSAAKPGDWIKEKKTPLKKRPPVSKKPFVLPDHLSNKPFLTPEMKSLRDSL